MWCNSRSEVLRDGYVMGVYLTKRKKKKFCFCLVSTVLKRIWPHTILLFQVGIRKKNYQIQSKWRWWWMRNTLHYTTFQVSFCETYYSNKSFLSFCLSVCMFLSFYLSLVLFFSPSLSLYLLIWALRERKSTKFNTF